MTEHNRPGVYIEEIERGPRPIEGVSTNTAAMLGETERGSIAPRVVTSVTEFARWFGQEFDDTKVLPLAVRGFFENGGRRAFISRLVGKNATTSEATFGDFSVRAAGAGAWGSRVFAKIGPSTTKNADGTSVGFRLRLAYWNGQPPNGDPFEDGQGVLPPPVVAEDFDDLVTDEASPNFYARRVNFVDLENGVAHQGPELSVLAMLVRHPGVAATTRPADGATLLSGGADDVAALDVDDFRGLPAGARNIEQGLAALEHDACRDVSLVYAPAVSAEIARAIVLHCEAMRFRIAVIDCDRAAATHTLDPRVVIADTTHAAFYCPWLVIKDPHSAAHLLVPPGGSVLGIYARIDAERGVFKAPANEIVRGALSLEYSIDEPTQDVLNPKGVNVIRQFPGRGIVLWGARTLSSNTLWKYISVRRLFIFLERSIYEGTQWVVFEPNDDRLWARVMDTIRLFLRSQWRSGALFGQTESEAFFIACDRTTMTQDDILNGRLICEIGIAAVRPAEFVIFRIFQHTAEAH